MKVSLESLIMVKILRHMLRKTTGLIQLLKEKGVKITAKPAEDSPWYMTFLISWFPMILLIGVWIFFMRQMQSGGGKAMAFGKSRARLDYR